MKMVINIIEDRINNAKKQIKWDLMPVQQLYHKRRIKNNEKFIKEAKKAIEILKAAQERLEI